ncbi:hypothetical protein SE17_36705 [Kouleothrix aurantiaca]|uniref:Uncharacterized protein n=1 Tax=Kouleothrix aurantiaca TaxID=186479 RepID=A0A0P9CST1_9CHLR|nr:hypothetical protein SE17_36705 [Kouleothrix aurantiaca]
MKRNALLAIGVAALLVALAYAIAGRWIGTLAAVLVGAAWLAGVWRELPNVSGVGLAGAAIVAAAGPTQGAPAPPLLLGMVAALVAWDLARFAARLRAAEVADAAAFERAHLRYVGVVAGVGLALGGLALVLRVAISFGWVIFFGVVAIVALGQLVRTLQREGG